MELNLTIIQHELAASSGGESESISITLSAYCSTF